MAGGKLKEVGTKHWYCPNANSTNSIGFTALPGDRVYEDDDFSTPGKFGAWWSITESDDAAYYLDLSFKTSSAEIYDAYKTTFRSVRCILN